MCMPCCSTTCRGMVATTPLLFSLAAFWDCPPCHPDPILRVAWWQPPGNQSNMRGSQVGLGPGLRSGGQSLDLLRVETDGEPQPGPLGGQCWSEVSLFPHHGSKEPERVQAPRTPGADTPAHWQWKVPLTSHRHHPDSGASTLEGFLCTLVGDT